MKIKILKNGNEKNITPPRDGDLGYNIACKEALIKGRFMSYTSEEFVDGEVGLQRYMTDPTFYVFSRVDYIEYNTGIQLQTEKGCYIYPRSSLSKRSLAQCNSVGVIDPSYTGNLIVRFNYIFQPEDFIDIKRAIINVDKIYNIGDDVGQIVFDHSYNKEIELEYVEKLEETERGSGRFGSTDKQ